MNSQPGPESDSGALRPAAITDRLFLALFPDAAAAAAIAEMARQLHAAHGLRGRLVPPERLHLTLLFLGDFPALPTWLVERTCRALADLRAPAFAVCLDEVYSFPGRRVRPLVLAGAVAPSPLHDLWSRLRVALHGAGVHETDTRPWTPHVTLLRDASVLAPRRVAPLCWVAREFALVRSRVGHGVYETLARFALDDGAATNGGR